MLKLVICSANLMTSLSTDVGNDLLSTNGLQLVEK